MTWLALAAWARAHWRAVALVVLLAMLPAAHWLGQRRGRAVQRAEDDARSAAALAAASERYRAKEADHVREVEEVRIEYAKRDAAARALDEARARELASGARRVRVPVTRCGPAAAPAGTPAARVDGAGSAELSPAFAAALDGIACDCDRYARQVTGLQAWARAAVKLCNGGAR